MKEIPLTQGYVALVDDCDYERVSAHKWHAEPVPRLSGICVYAQRTFRLEGKTCAIRLHRFLICPPPGLVVDHKNGDGLNNVRDNLRICSRSQNQWNRKQQNGKSQYKGVYLDLRNGKWVSQISAHGQRKHLGCFCAEIDAAREYDKAAVEIFGAFAQLNF